MIPFTWKGESMRKFMIRNKVELLMLILAFIGSSMLGIFALSHIYGLMNILLNIFMVLAIVSTIVIIYHKFLARRLYTFVVNIFANRKAILNQIKIKLTTLNPKKV